MLEIMLKKSWSYILIAILCMALWHSGNKAVKYAEQANMLESTITDLNQEIKFTKIRLSDSISLYQAEVKSLNITRNNLKSKYDKLLKASKVKPKDVNSVTEMTTVIHQVDTVVAVVDTFGGITAKLQDPFIDIDVQVKPDLNTIIDYEVRDSLTVLDVQKKHSLLFGLIKWKEHKGVRVINHNPKANIVSLQTVNVIE